MPRQAPIEQARRWWRKNADADHKAIEQAQVDADAAPFIVFVWHLIRQSALELQAKQSGRKAAQR
jgi:hypothetical protein